MNEHDVIRFMGRFPDAIDSKGRIKAPKWKCSKCEIVYDGGEKEIEIPSPCNCCGSIFFETV